MLTAAEIETCLRDSFPNGRVTIEDPRGDGAYLAITVVDAKFAGLPLIDQHRLVYKALGVETIDPPPALSLRTRVPA